MSKMTPPDEMMLARVRHEQEKMNPNPKVYLEGTTHVYSQGGARFGFSPLDYVGTLAFLRKLDIESITRLKLAIGAEGLFATQAQLEDFVMSYWEVAWQKNLGI